MALFEFDEVVIVYNRVIEEHPDSLRFLKDCEDWFGQKIITTVNAHYEGSIYKVFETNYMRTPSGSPCTRALKKQVRERFQRPTDVQILGYTAEEMDRIDRFIDGNNDIDFYPILQAHGITKKECFDTLVDAGIELPLMYRLGYDHNNCVGCVKGGMGYWNKVRKDFPEVFDRMAAFEVRKGYTVLKDKNGPLYLKDLDPDRGRYESPGDCGIFCN